MEAICNGAIQPHLTLTQYEQRSGLGVLVLSLYKTYRHNVQTDEDCSRAICVHAETKTYMLVLVDDAAHGCMPACAEWQDCRCQKRC